MQGLEIFAVIPCETLKVSLVPWHRQVESLSPGSPCLEALTRSANKVQSVGYGSAFARAWQGRHQPACPREPAGRSRTGQGAGQQGGGPRRSGPFSYLAPRGAG